MSEEQKMTPAQVLTDEQREAPASGQAAPSDEDLIAVGESVGLGSNLSVVYGRAILQLYGQAPAASAEPVATLHDDGHYTFHAPKPDGYDRAGWRMQVYAAPVAAQAPQGPQIAGHDRLLRAAATQEARDGIGAMDALFNLAVRMTPEGRVPMIRTIREALAHFSAPTPPASALAEGLGWKVRERRNGAGELMNCFVEAPREGDMAYGLEVLGDDYTGYGDVERKYEHCKMIVAWANAAPPASAAPAPPPDEHAAFAAAMLAAGARDYGGNTWEWDDADFLFKFWKQARSTEAGAPEAWRPLMKDLADELENEIHARYQGYPSNDRRYVRDLLTVKEARELLKE